MLAPEVEASSRDLVRALGCDCEPSFDRRTESGPILTCHEHRCALMRTLSRRPTR